MSATELSPAEVIAERGLPPIESVWRYRQPNYRTEDQRRRFGEDALADTAEAIVVVHSAPMLRHGYLFDVYLRFNSRQGGFDLPGPASREAGNKLTHLQPHEFWGLVDQGVLTRIDLSN